MNNKDFNFVKDKLRACDNIQDMLNILTEHYDLKNCKPTALTKPAFINGIITGLRMLNPKIK